MEFVHVPTGILLEIDVAPEHRLDPITIEAFAGRAHPEVRDEHLELYLRDEFCRRVPDAAPQLIDEIIAYAAGVASPETLTDKDPDDPTAKIVGRTNPRARIELTPKAGNAWAWYTSESRPGETRWPVAPSTAP